MRAAPAFVAGIVALFIFIGMAAAFETRMVGLGLFLAFIIVSLGAYVVSHLSRLPLNREEVAVLSPALPLTRTQRSCLEAWITLGALHLPAEEEAELASGLHRLVDEEAKLLAMHEGSHVRAAKPEEIEAERASLQARLDRATDVPSREALEHSIETCERRLASAQRLSIVVQRIDAQIEMIAQSAGDIRDGLQHLRMVPEAAGLSIELGSVRQTLEQVTNHAAAIEAAVSEVQALELKS